MISELTDESLLEMIQLFAMRIVCQILQDVAALLKAVSVFPLSL
jgi:hypothetical protein